MACYKDACAVVMNWGFALFFFGICGLTVLGLIWCTVLSVGYAVGRFHPETIRRELAKRFAREQS